MYRQYPCILPLRKIIKKCVSTPKILKLWESHRRGSKLQVLFSRFFSFASDTKQVPVVISSPFSLSIASATRTMSCASVYLLE